MPSPLDVFGHRQVGRCSGGFYFCNVSKNKNNFQNLWLFFGSFCDMKKFFPGHPELDPITFKTTKEYQ